MPPGSAATADRLLDYAAVAANTLRDVATASQIPFLARVCTITLTIIPMVENTRFQRERCLCILEEIHHSLCALTYLAILSDDIQAPRMLDQIAQYAGTLQKFDACLRSQRELGTIKRLFKQGEITAQLDTCETELRASLGIFTAEQAVRLATAVIELNLDTETRHQELLELISSQSSSFDTVSLIGRSSSNVSSGSLSLLPAFPKIFHGRETELEELIDILMATPARVAILGPGGMGKTTLAVAALHDHKVENKYQTRHFISCDSAHTRDSLVAIIASHLGLDTSRTSERALLALLSAGHPCLMILDNFETAWEALEGREKVEAFLALLADIPHVALLLTMRGAERPGKVQWTHPFMRPLLPLEQAAARQTFIEIADEIYDGSEVDQLSDITDNIPLAVHLVAGIAASVGCQDTIERWNLERTALLSAVELLSLMSLLSDGISDLDLVQSNIPILDVPNCKTTLIRTSLAYIDNVGRFKVLAPIRDYIQLARPPSMQLVRPLRKYLIEILKLHAAWWHGSSFASDLVPRIISNLGNLHSILLQGLDSDEDLRESILGIIMLSAFTIPMNRGFTPLMLRLPEVLSGMDDSELHGRFIEARFYDVVASYYHECAGDLEKAEDFCRRALSVISQSNSHTAKLRPLTALGLIEYQRANYSKALHLAHETHRFGRALGNVRGELIGIRLQAMCYTSMGEFKQCMQCLKEGKELVVQAGLQGGQLEILLMGIEAEVYLLKTEYSDARRIQMAILHQTSKVLSPVDHAHALSNIAFLDIVTGACTDVVSRNLNAATTIFGNVPYPHGISISECFRTELRQREGDIAGARGEYMRMFAAAYNRNNQLVGFCLAKLADPTNPVHSDTECERWAIVFLAYTLRPQVRSRLLIHQALRCLGDVLWRQGADDTALNILELALEGFMQMDVHQSRAECMRTMGDVHVHHGDICRAREMWEAARPLFERSEQKKEVVKIDEKLQALGVVQKLDKIPQVELPTPEGTLQDSGADTKKQKSALIPAL
ncbi:NB-ARC domain-containing protein [Mycena venus]|uniref:NB-ARC domain-containing protein n=1 Tax=Mycena venus TaxID=2733690 RepID=A0A8H7CRE4_9AGAR|nr:NB-ARC domain-containing protein [Mycena venus]